MMGGISLCTVILNGFCIDSFLNILESLVEFH